MKIGGSEWHDPATPGEGLDLFVYPDQQVVAKWYGATPAGAPEWFIATGRDDGDQASLVAVRPVFDTSGRIMRSADGTPVEYGAGNIYVREDGNKLAVRLQFTNRFEARDLTLVPLYVPAVTAPTTRLKIEKALGGGRWLEYTEPLPYVGTTPVDVSKIPGTWLTVRVTVTEGTLTIKDVVVNGRNKPSIVGVTKGLYGKGEQFTLEFRTGELSQPLVHGELVGYSVWTEELGEVISVAAQVLHS